MVRQVTRAVFFVMCVSLFATTTVLAKDDTVSAPLKMLIEKASKDEIPAAQSQLGSVYYDGTLGAERDYEKAFYWFNIAAEQGFARAQFNVGLCYELGDEQLTGIGVKKDLAKALEWYKKAADQGLPHAQRNAAILLTETENFAEATHYFKLGAKYGDTFCRREYGRNVLLGRGAKRDVELAVRLLEPSAAEGDSEAQLLLADCYAGTYPELPQNVGKMIEYLWQAASDNLPEAQSKIGFCFEEGLGVHRDTEQAVKWYRRAAQQNYGPAMVNLGHCYMNGRGIAQDKQTGYEWYRKAADNGITVGLYNVAVCYANGDGTDKDEKKAAEYFRRAADNGYARAQYSLGVLYESGQGVTQNDGLAHFWYKQAADQDEPRALTALAQYTYEGIGTEKNEAAARNLFQEAAAMGEADAIEALKRWQ